MSILVTGGCGYIGSHMVHELRDAGETVVVVDNLSTGHSWALPKDVPLVIGNVGDEALISKVISAHKVDAIIHFAGSIVVPESVADPLGYYQNNTVNSRNLMAAAVKGGVKNFIFSSTAAVYGNPETSPVTEDASPNPLSPYGWSKLMTEVMLADTARAHDSAMSHSAISTWPAQIPRLAPVSPRLARPISSRSRAKQPSASVRAWTFSAPTTKPPTAPVFAITST